MLFTKDTWAGMADGSITLTFRTWRRPQAVAGRSYRSPVGMLAVSAVDVVEVASITEEEARRSGAPDRARLVARLGGEDAPPVYRIAFTFAGEDPRRALPRGRPRRRVHCGSPPTVGAPGQGFQDRAVDAGHAGDHRPATGDRVN